MKKNLLFISFWMFGVINSFSQEHQKGEVHGNFEMTSQIYNVDTTIDAPIVNEKLLMNGFANIIYTKGNFTSGVRYESYLNALQGIDPRYKGSGITYRYANYNLEGLDITVGNYYEQFGSGMIFRSYEARQLGIDNAMDGIRLKYSPFKGLYLKGVIGRQRLFFSYGPGIVRGIDGELVINELSPRLDTLKTKIIVGGSFVSKFQEDQDPQYVLPENVGAGAGRITISRPISKGIFSLNGEYVYKANDPSADNYITYNHGEAALVSASYSQKGLGFTLSAKSVNNMSFRSDRNESVNNLMINYLPALTKQHTYNLAATLYPYATQPNGETAVQADLIYKIPKKTKLGGKYGTTIYLNYSEARSSDTTMLYDYVNIKEPHPADDSTRIGYTNNFFGIGKKVYFKDFNIEISRKINKKLKLKASYFNFVYNSAVINPGNPNKFNHYFKKTIYSSIYVLDVLYKLKPKHAVRVEAQMLNTKQDYGDWATGLIEYTYSPHWFLAVMDQWNYGNTNPKYRIHYPNLSVGYNKGGNRFMASYGRQRAGIFCVGGVCRQVPASNGFTLTVTSSF